MMEEDQPPAWFTDMQRGDFKVGDEVTIDLGECTRLLYQHGTQEQGVRGFILTIDGDRSFDPETHPICVYFRRPLRGKGLTGYYAPAELRHFDLMAHIAAIAAQAN